LPLIFSSRRCVDLLAFILTGIDWSLAVGYQTLVPRDGANGATFTIVMLLGGLVTVEAWPLVDGLRNKFQH